MYWRKAWKSYNINHRSLNLLDIQGKTKPTCCGRAQPSWFVLNIFSAFPIGISCQEQNEKAQKVRNGQMDTGKDFLSDL